jgi:hypothetical protein
VCLRVRIGDGPDGDLDLNSCSSNLSMRSHPSKNLHELCQGVCLTAGAGDGSGGGLGSGGGCAGLLVESGCGQGSCCPQQDVGLLVRADEGRSGGLHSTALAYTGLQVIDVILCF